MSRFFGEISRGGDRFGADRLGPTTHLAQWIAISDQRR